VTCILEWREHAACGNVIMLDQSDCDSYHVMLSNPSNCCCCRNTKLIGGIKIYQTGIDAPKIKHVGTIR